MENVENTSMDDNFMAKLNEVASCENNDEKIEKMNEFLDTYDDEVFNKYGHLIVEKLGKDFITEVSQKNNPDSQ